MRLPVVTISLIACLSAACAGSGDARPVAKPQPAVRATGLMTIARAAHSVALLPSGKVLVTGGCTLPGCDDVEGQTDTAELYDPETRRFTRTGRMNRIRIAPETETLPNGKVLLAGGYSGTKPTAAVELYDEASEKFTDVAPMLAPRADGTATRLGDGRILLIGGDDGKGPLASAEIYDPRTGRFSATGSMAAPRKIHSATRLTDGRVLVVGGATTAGEVVRTAELYDPRAGTFAKTGRLSQIRYKHGAARLADGRVLIVGGAPAFDLGLRYRESEIYDPRTGRFTAGPRLSVGRYHIAEAVLPLSRGRVLVAGDAQVLEVYEPRRKSYRMVGRIGLRLGFSTVLRLRNGTILIVGGYSSVGENPVRRAWTYEPR